MKNYNKANKMTRIYVLAKFIIIIQDSRDLGHICLGNGVRLTQMCALIILGLDEGQQVFPKVRK